MGINIDGRITVYYTHVFFDEHAVAPVRRKSTNGYSTFSAHSYNDVWEAYIKRTNRMLASNEPPCFLINAYDRYGWTYSDVKSIIDCPTKYKIYMVTKYNIDTTNPLIKCIVIPNFNTSRLSNPDNIVADYFDDINNHFTL